jgi:uncharacterized protein
MIRDVDIKKVKNFALKHSKIDDIHGFNHTERVLKMCNELGKHLNANLDILTISAFLHDIGRRYEINHKITRNHADISAQLALEFLTKTDLCLAEKDIKSIIHCIKAHSYSNNIKPITLEAKILHDADKLDALGAIGLYRTIAYTTSNGGKIEQVIEHLENKIVKIYEMLLLDISKEIAEKRQEIILNFYSAIKRELELFSY